MFLIDVYKRQLPRSRKPKRNLGSPLRQESPTKFHAETSQIKTKYRYEALVTVQEASPNTSSNQKMYPQTTHIPPLKLYGVTKMYRIW